MLAIRGAEYLNVVGHMLPLNLSRFRAAPGYLLSGLLRSGTCGGFSKISQHHDGCSIARKKGTCTNMRTVRHDRIEEIVIAR